MASGARLILIFAAVFSIVVQYTPLRLCAVERLALGTNCHDRDTSHEHADDAARGLPSDGGHQCACEHPKPDGQRAFAATVMLPDWAILSAAVVVSNPLEVQQYPLREWPDPERRAGIDVNLPLLI